MAMQRLTRTWFVLALAVVAALLVWLRAAYMKALHPECPLHNVAIDVKRAGGTQTLTVIPVADSITNVPEFHDCQRFLRVTRDTARYGGLFAVFASIRLDTIWEHALFVPASALAAAEIVSWEDSSYKELGIGPGFSCLYLFRASGSTSAKMIQYGKYQPDCSQQVPADTIGPGITSLTVLRTPYDGVYQKTDVPNVARWGWDETNFRHYIGIKCGNGWCNVGSSGGLAPSPAFVPTAEVTTQGQRVSAIAGWYDEQQLAIPDGASALALSPAPVKGTFIPDPLLDSHTETQFAVSWIPVAYVAIPTALPTYTANFGMDAAPPTAMAPLTSLNTISLCQGSWVQCRAAAGVSASAEPEPSCPAWPFGRWPAGEAKPASAARWWSRTASPTGGTTYRCVIRRDHSNKTDGQAKPIHVPGTARWRWMEGDETTWTRCAEGCCEVIH